MTFLQPLILWGLPFVLVPVVIHLLNRLRHRPMPWAAMMFLRSATRKSTRYARLRQLLILLLRALAVLGLVVALSRPLAGGWMGWMSGGAPDTILVLLDRSASMESLVLGGQSSKRTQALELFARSAKALGPASRLVLAESVHQDPQEIKPAEALTDHPRTRATDTAADLPGLMQTALDWIARNQPGSVELWIASDLQRSSWLPENDRWPAVTSALAALPQGVRVRLLGLNRPWEGNRSIAIGSVKRRSDGAEAGLELVLEIQRTETHTTTVPVALTLDGVSSQLDLTMEGPSLRYRHTIALGNNPAGGWGKVSLPADVHPADNTSYFVYAPPVPMRATVRAEEDFAGRVLQLAAAPNPHRTNESCQRFRSGEEEKIDWDAQALVMWQGSLPQGETSRRMQAWVEAGGIALFFPAGLPATWDGAGWGALQETAGETTFVVGRWEEQTGPLSGTEEGLRLPLHELGVKKRQPILGESRALAWFEDGVPLWSRRTTGRGQVHFCATLPHPAWSRLHEGAVLVPLVQRLFEEGGQRFSLARRLECGEPWPAPAAGFWSAVAPPEAVPAQLRAGVFRSGDRWLAIDRPAREDEPEQLEPERVRQLFGDLSFQMFEEKRGGPASIQSELWRFFLVAMLMLLLAEAVLILPER